MSSHQSSGVVPDVDPVSAYEALGREPGAQLVDVRTRAEWSFVGVPDLSPIGKDAILLEWQGWPGMEVQSDFLDRLDQALAERGLDRSAPIYFLCRSGVRSHAAARAASASGYGATFNVAGGFEGPPDGERHRGRVEGWKARSLPWVQA